MSHADATMSWRVYSILQPCPRGWRAPRFCHQTCCLTDLEDAASSVGAVGAAACRLDDMSALRATSKGKRSTAMLDVCRGDFRAWMLLRFSQALTGPA